LARDLALAPTIGRVLVTGPRRLELDRLGLDRVGSLGPAGLLDRDRVFRLGLLGVEGRIGPLHRLDLSGLRLLRRLVVERGGPGREVVAARLAEEGVLQVDAAAVGAGD